MYFGLLLSTWNYKFVSSQEKMVEHHKDTHYVKAKQIPDRQVSIFPK